MNKNSFGKSTMMRTHWGCSEQWTPRNNFVSTRLTWKEYRCVLWAVEFKAHANACKCLQMLASARGRYAKCTCQKQKCKHKSKCKCNCNCKRMILLALTLVPMLHPTLQGLRCRVRHSGIGGGVNLTYYPRKQLEALSLAKWGKVRWTHLAFALA